MKTETCIQCGVELTDDEDLWCNDCWWNILTQDEKRQVNENIDLMRERGR